MVVLGVFAVMIIGMGLFLYVGLDLKDAVIAKPEVSSLLFREVIDRQSLQVDSVSGVSVSSKAYLKSLENTFKGHRL